MEKTPRTIAQENMANRLADRIRDIWLTNRSHGREQWEETFYEDTDGISFLRDESFPHLQGIDYIFKWWGAEAVDGLSGELEVLWKVKAPEGMNIYKTWIRFADRDFVLGEYSTEERRRAANREAFRGAFAEWQQIYAEIVK